MNPATLIRTEPHNADAERTTLGALLADPDRIIDVAPLLSPDDFFDPTYRLIYAAIHRLYEARKPIDFVTVAAELKDNQRLSQIGGSAFLAELSSSVPTSSHAEHYAAIVRDKALHRQLQRAAASIQAF